MNRQLLATLLKTKGTKENPSLSPLAVATALEALKLGAAGETAKELAALLAYPEKADSPPAAREQSTWSWLVKQSASADWSLHHGLWYHQRHPLRPSYLDTVSRQPSITLDAVDFSQPGAAKLLGAWAAKHSAGKLSQPVAPSRINDLTRMVWISLLNYQGKWQQSFDPAANTTSAFHAPGGEIKVTLMHGRMDLRLVNQPGYGTVALLPMAGNRTVLEIRLPERQMSRASPAAAPAGSNRPAAPLPPENPVR
jgi:serpin B